MRSHRFNILMLICLLGHCFGYAQADIAAIKSSEKYWYAEGKGVTVDEADHDALSQIIRQISVSIVSDFKERDHSEEINGTINSHYIQEGEISSSSFASLQNVEMMVLQPEPDAIVFRWVAKKEVDRMFKEREKKIRDFVEAGKKAEQRLQIDDAVRNYYWALMLAKVNRDLVYCKFNGEEENCLTFLPLKIKSVLSHVKAELQDCTFDGNRYYAKMRFTYGDKDVASIQLRYFDGQSYVGPLLAHDGLGELDLLKLPSDGKLKLRYEYSFRKEAENLDAELQAVFRGTSLVPIGNANIDIPVKVNEKKQSMKAGKEDVEILLPQEDLAKIQSIETEPVTTRERIELTQVDQTAEYFAALQSVELAIRQQNPEVAYSHFAPDCYKLFCRLLQETGSVTVVGKEQKYDFVSAHNQILGRFIKVKIKFKNGQTFMENLTFRFDESDKKIVSFAFALTSKAEDDIFNAAASWPDVSRYTILQFMEDYQTAYALKRLDYIESVFSDGAIIITGSVLKPAQQSQVNEGMVVNLSNENVKYTRQTKSQYISKLKTHFHDREYIHLTFEDNLTKVINAPRIPKGTAFAIQINQMYNSPVYSDRGYLTLVLDVSKKLPVIHVRLWQPEKSNMLGLDEFMNKFEF